MRKWNELEFEWDEEKARSNYIKHGVRFETAAHVFEDENLIEYYDEYHGGSEERYQVIGKVNQILFVVYTERKERIRLISARKATKMERRLYHDC
ncbi:MAG: BrnT family toxin [Oscillibacter sp.]|nr:BrnT family toxin [Oscillibacter sp.]